MKIVRPYAKLLLPWANESRNDFLLNESGTEALKYIEWCSRISHRSEDSVTQDSWKRIIQNVVVEHGDWSVVEHVSVSVDAVVDRGITHEWVRHRLFSFTQESTRFVSYAKEKDGKVIHPASFIYPQPEINCERCLSGMEVKYRLDATAWKHYAPDNVWEDCAYHPQWLFAIEACENQYKELLRQGWRPQEARSVFPNALASRIIVTGNLRNWRYLFIMRTTQETHPQFKQVTIPLLKEFQETFPILFDDITPLQKQSESMKKIR